MRKDLLTSESWGKLPPPLANMEHYGQPIPAKLPGKDVQTLAELDLFAQRFKRTGFTPVINWHRNLSRNWRMRRGLDQTIRVASLMISVSEDVVLRPSIADGMSPHLPISNVIRSVTDGTGLRRIGRPNSTSSPSHGSIAAFHPAEVSPQTTTSSSATIRP